MELTLFNYSQFPRYRCHKVVRAAQVGEIRKESKGHRIFSSTPGVPSFCVSEEFYQQHKPVPGGYIVVYEDGYVSFSPQKAFEEGYMPDSGARTFSMALLLLKAGHRMARAGWNGKGMFIFLVPGSTFKVNRAPLLGIYPEGTEIKYHAHVDMKTADGQVVPWIASQTDLLAEDWQIVPEE